MCDYAVIVRPHLPFPAAGPSDCAAPMRPYFPCIAAERSDCAEGVVRLGAGDEGGASGCGCRAARQAATPWPLRRRIALSGCLGAPASRGSGGEDVCVCVCVCVLCVRYVCIITDVYMYKCMIAYANT